MGNDSKGYHSEIIAGVITLGAIGFGIWAVSAGNWVAGLFALLLLVFAFGMIYLDSTARERVARAENQSFETQTQATREAGTAIRQASEVLRTAVHTADTIERHKARVIDGEARPVIDDWAETLPGFPGDGLPPRSINELLPPGDD